MNFDCSEKSLTQWFHGQSSKVRTCMYFAADVGTKHCQSIKQKNCGYVYLGEPWGKFHHCCTHEHVRRASIQKTYPEDAPVYVPGPDFNHGLIFWLWHVMGKKPFFPGLKQCVWFTCCPATVNLLSYLFEGALQFQYFKQHSKRTITSKQYLK